MRRIWIVSYDIADDRRRLKVAQALLGWGDRIEESLFECALRADQLPALQTRIHQLIDPAQDAVSLIPVCRDCQQRFHGEGLGRREAMTTPTHFCV